MTPVLLTPVLLCAGFLLGSLPFALLVCRLSCGLDPREHGSGNPGATNVGRLAGRGPGLLVLLLDAGKGAAAVGLAKLAAPELEALRVGAGLAAVLGHVASPFLGFRGGKGVATAAGVLILLDVRVFTVALLVFGLALALARAVSVASLAAAAVLPLALVALEGPDGALGPALPRLAGFCLTTSVVFWRHRSNMWRILQGTESRIGTAPSDPDDVSDTETRPPPDS